MEEVFFRHRKPLVQRPKTERGAVCSGDSRGACVASPGSRPWEESSEGGQAGARAQSHRLVSHSGQLGFYSNVLGSH